jgi:hypothetical protein
MQTTTFKTIFSIQNFNLMLEYSIKMNSQQLLRHVDNNILDRIGREGIMGDTEEPEAVDGQQGIRGEPVQADAPVDAVVQQERKPEVSNESEMNEIVRQMSKTRVPLTNEFELPEPEDSTNFVELVRKANANFEFQKNLFNTKF